ncbi:MAG: cytidine deaminase [Saprospiraceae bacterium]
MEIIDILISVKCLDSFEEIKDENIIRLCRSAFKSVDHAYAPYSQYKVGAAVLLNNGKIVEGSNQENAVFPLGLCAERVAIFSSNTTYPKAKIEAIAVVTFGDLEDGQLPGFPCGSCRQAIIDMEYRHGNDIHIYVLDKNKKVYIIQSAKDLLPFPFDHNAL